MQKNQDFDQRMKICIFRGRREKMKMRNEKLRLKKKICGLELVRTKTRSRRAEEQKRGSQWEERVGYESSLLQ